MSRKGKFLATAMAAVSMGGAYALAQNAAGPFTQGQVTAGRADYLTNCAGCHSANLAGGGDAPSLTGATFNSSWASKSTKELYQFVSTSMPYGNAGNLSAASYSNIIAFILAANGAQPGTAPLTANSDVKISSVANGQAVAALGGGGGGGQRGPGWWRGGWRWRCSRTAAWRPRRGAVSRWARRFRARSRIIRMSPKTCWRTRPTMTG